MGLTAKNLAEPDERVTFPNGGGDVVSVGGMMVGRGTLQPGWKWSNDVKPLAHTSSCELPHTGVVLAGQLHVEMDDGTAHDLREGDVYVIPAGHDAWVVGSAPCTTLDWTGNASDYTKPKN